MKTSLKELFILHFLNDGVRTTFVILLPFMAKDFSLSLAQVGFLGSSQPLIAALVALPTGYILGRFEGFRLIFMLLLVYSLGALGITFSFSLLLVLFAFYFAALGFGMFHTVGFALTAKSSDSSNIGINMGNFTAIGDIGRVALPPLAVLSSSIIGWRITMGIIGIVGLLLFFIFQLIRQQKDGYLSKAKNNSQNHKDFLKDIIEVFRQKQARYVTISAIIDSLASSPIYVYLPFLFVSYGIDAVKLSIAMGGFFIGSLIGKYLLGRLINKLGNLKVFIFSEICMAIALIFIVQTALFLLLLLLSILLGMFTKGTSPVVQTMFSDLADKEHYHKVFAVSELVIGLAAVVTIILMGGLADKAGIKIVFYLCAALAICAVLPIYLFSKKHLSK